jgi:hypothetical protein
MIARRASPPLGELAEAAARREAMPPGQLVDELYRGHALRLTRTALLLVGDRPSAEDVVQEAFIGLFRGLGRLSDPDRAVAYLRASVLNGCRSVLRSRKRAWPRKVAHDPAVWSAEAAALAGEERREVLQSVAGRDPGAAQRLTGRGAGPDGRRGAPRRSAVLRRDRGDGVCSAQAVARRTPRRQDVLPQRRRGRDRRDDLQRGDGHAGRGRRRDPGIAEGPGGEQAPAGATPGSAAACH